MDKLDFCAKSDIGLVRTNNEDTFIACHIWDERHVLCAAVDGVGGYEGGEIAAEMARDVIVDYLSGFNEGDALDLLKQAVLEANNKIYERRKADARYPRMSCVASAAIVDMDSDRLYMVHVGDSRVYIYQDGELQKISHDHSLVGYREEIGELTEEQAMNHPQRNLIERSLGDSMRLFEDKGFADCGIYPLLPGAVVLLCSDGLTDMVTSKEIAAVLASGKEASEMVDALIAKANAAGGKDNVTVVVAAVAMQEMGKEQEAALAETYEQESPQSKENKSGCRYCGFVAGFICGILLMLLLYMSLPSVRQRRDGQMIQKDSVCVRCDSLKNVPYEDVE